MDKIRILVVDDESEMRYVLRQAFEFAGYEVTDAADGHAGLEAFRMHRPALVVSDICMPGMNGLHMLRGIRQQCANAKVILITGYAHDHQVAGDDDAKPNGFFEKPFTLTSLISTANGILATS